MKISDLVDRLVEIQNYDDVIGYDPEVMISERDGRVLPILNVELDGNGTVYLDPVNE